jgi:DUF4097 and DUF4098 domain-containing protein YvlB
MTHTTKIVLTCAGGAVVVGAVLMAIGFACGSKFTIVRDQKGIHAADIEKRQVVNAKLGSFDSIDCDVDSEYVSVVPGTGYSIKINSAAYYGTVTYSVKNGKLYIENKAINHYDQLNMNFGINIKKSTVTVTVPKNQQFDTVTIKSDYGDVTAVDLDAKALTVNTQDGDCAINAVRCGSLMIADSYGAVDLGDITADTLNVKGEDGDMLCKNINGKSVEVSNDYGKTALSAVKATTLKVTNGNGDCSLSNSIVQQSIAISNDFGGTDLKAVKTDALTVTNDNGDMTLTGCSGNSCTLKSEYGAITADSLSSGGLAVNEEDGDISLSGSFRGKNSLRSSYGGITFRSSLSEKQYNIDVDQQDGDVSVNGKTQSDSLTERNNAANSLEIESENGDVAMNFR